MKLIAELLKDRPDAVEIQVEAAMIYQAWGSTSTSAESDQKFSIAMLGDHAFAKNHSAIGMWGWADLHEKLAKSPDAAKYKAELLEARYNIALYRLKSSLGPIGGIQAMSLAGAYKDVLETAKENVLDPQEYERFNVLYGRIALAMGRTLEDLPRNAGAPASRPIDTSPDVKPETVE